MDEKLKELIEECKAFEMKRFRRADRDTSDALHIPYSGMGDNRDYVSFKDYCMSDVYALVGEV